LSQTKWKPSGLWISGDDGLHVRQKIVLRARGSGVGSHHFSRHHITAENEGTGAVARVFKLAPLSFSRNQRQAGVLARKPLEPQSVHRYSPCAHLA
jgi:hypothetical protein